MSLRSILFSTYTGYIIQVLPIALAAGLAGGLLKYFCCRERSVGRALFAGLFVSYLTGLLCLVFALDSISVAWNRLVFHAESGVRLLTADGSRLARLMPSFMRSLTGEQIGNILMFLPLGLLYPLSRKNAWLLETIAVGFLLSLAIELLQPLAGRITDISDLSMNTLGVTLSACVIHPLLWLIRRGRSGKEIARAVA